MHSSITTKLVYPIDPCMPWGPNETAEHILSLARLDTLNDYRDIDQNFTSLTTSWITGPQANPILEITLTYRGDDMDLSPNSTRGENLLSLLGQVFSTNLNWFWRCHQQSLSVQCDVFSSLV